MITRPRVGLLILVVILVLPPSVQTADAASPQVTVSFEPSAVVSYTFEPEPFTSRYMYLLAVSVDEGIDAFAIGLEFDPALIVAGGRVRGGGIHLEPCGMSPYTDWICGMVECVGPSPIEWLVELPYMFLQTPAADMLVCAKPPSFSQVTPHAASYHGCETTYAPFEMYPTHINVPAGCAMINPTRVVGSETASWGALKSHYGRHE